MDHLLAMAWCIPILLKYVQGCMKTKVTFPVYISIDLEWGRELKTTLGYLTLILNEEIGMFEPIVLIVSLT